MPAKSEKFFLFKRSNCDQKSQHAVNVIRSKDQTFKSTCVKTFI